MNKAYVKASNEHADEIAKAVRANESSWDDTYRVALLKNLVSKWLGEGREPEMADEVTAILSEEFGLTGDDCVGLEWYVRESETRREELINSQDNCCDEIDENKASLEAATERAKSAKAAIEEGHSRLRFLSRELHKPYVFPLPSAPSRQRELAFADGEEWRAVPLADVLTGDVVLRSVVGEKLGPINLGEYAAKVQEFGLGDKPKKLTRKQWDRVEEIVQAWHLGREETPSDEATTEGEPESETTLPGGHGVVRRKKGRQAAAAR